MGELLEKQIDGLELAVRKLEKREEAKGKLMEELRAQNHVLVGKMEGEYCKLKVDLEVKSRETERLLLNNKTLAEVGTLGKKDEINRSNVKT